MILRRIAEHLKQQHWTSVFIELSVVVFGVFIGMQVSNWNEERVTRQKSAVFTARLVNDLRAEAWGVRLLVEYNQEVLRNVDKALRALSGDAPMTDEQFMVSAYRASQFAFNNRYRTTYDELVSTGEMGLITDQQLRQTATIVFTTPMIARVADDGKNSEYRRLFRRSVSQDIQDDLLKRCGDRIEDNQDPLVDLLDYPCTLTVPALKISAAARALRDNAETVPTLRLRFADIQTSLSDLQFNNPEISEGLARYERRHP